jgi:hypothetical protein
MAAVAERPKLLDVLGASTTPNVMWIKETHCADDGWPRATRISGIVLQQSIP